MTDIVALALAIPLTILNLIVLAEIIAGCLPERSALPPLQTGVQIAMLIPAHNEELDIAATVRTARQNAPDARVIVIADNCTDGTELQALSAGAEVIIRSNLSAIGKGYALAFGREHLAATPPDYVVLLDADTVPRPKAIDYLVRAAVHHWAVVQGSYWLEADAAASPRVKVSAAAFYLMNVIRLPGLDRLVKASVLTGSGIAAPWALFSRLPLATGHLAEDLMLGVWLLENGMPPRFASQAHIVGRASSDVGTRTQRDRWESGRRQVASEAILPLLRTALATQSLKAAWIAVRLIVPPLSTLAAINIAVAIVWAATLAFAGVAWVHPIQPITFGMLVVAVPISLMLHGRGDFARVLGHAGPYALWKFGLAVARRANPTVHWQRTDRN